MKELPNKMHELLKLALDDCKRSQGNGDILNMSVWLYEGKNNACEVCMAGAIMRNTLDIHVTIVDFDQHRCNPECLTTNENAMRLCAVDWMRSGKFTSAFEKLEALFPSKEYTEEYRHYLRKSHLVLHGLTQEHTFYHSVAPSKENEAHWYEEWYEIVDTLKKHDL